MKSIYYSPSRRGGAIFVSLKKVSFLLAIFALQLAITPIFAKTAIEKSAYGKTADGKAVDEYTLTNANGAEVKIITYGSIITLLRILDRNGNFDNVVLGFNKLSDYENRNPYFGALIGRYVHRIANAKFSMDGKDYALAANNVPNSLHGGNKGFDKLVWEAKEVPSDADVGLELSYLSPGGEEGYPGNLTVKVVYTLTADNAIKIEYTATTDKVTVLNLTHHSHFNLGGNGSSPIYDEILQINADKYTPVDATLIPTGELADVTGTPFDFRNPKTLGAGIRSGDEHLVLGRGYDHDFVLNRADKTTLEQAAYLCNPATGRGMEVWTTESGLQIYTGSFLDDTLVGSSSGMYRQGEGLCLETQHLPDSPNHSSFPSTELKPGDTYQSTTVYKFVVD